MGLLDNKIALVTGGSRGIGEAIVRRFAEQGATVAFTYVSENSAILAEKLAVEINENGGKAHAFRSDAASFSDAETLINAVVKEFGKLDIVVNNAGITRDNLMLRMTEQQWDDVKIGRASCRERV